LNSCDAIAHISRQKSLELIIEFAHLIKADKHVCFYKLFFLWIHLLITGGLATNYFTEVRHSLSSILSSLDGLSDGVRRDGCPPDMDSILLLGR
jgi:hypothetical protein